MLFDVADVAYLKSSELLPPEWQGEGSDPYIFNPTICKTDKGFAAVYRAVLPNSELRRLASCRLTEDFQVVQGSVVALSDLIEFAAPDLLDERALSWHADPRLFSLGGKIYLSWNDGAAATPKNHQFLMLMDVHGTRPEGLAREIVTSRSRRPVEKNWMFFEDDLGVWCIYSTFPHDVMRVNLSSPDYVECEPAYSTVSESNYEQLYGVVRGGAQPIRLDKSFLVLAHSSYKMSDALRYYSCMVYEFSDQPPYEIIRCAEVPFDLPMGDNPRVFGLDKLNATVGGVIYPCGIIIVGNEAIISYGINDERAAIAKVSLSRLVSLLQPTVCVQQAHVTSNRVDELEAAPVEVCVPKLFWWDAKEKSFDGSFGSRKFRTGNFGDIASRDIVEAVSGCRTRRWSDEGVKLLAIGSIMHNSRDGDIIWGSGVKGTHRHLHETVKRLDVRAVRGPLSLDVLRSHGIDLSRVNHVFDPGCLVAEVFKAAIEAFDRASNEGRGAIRIIPHYRDDIFFRRLYPSMVNSFISVDETPLGMVQKLLGAEAVFSSSLHGIIFAESLGIPAYWLRPHGGEDTFKFYDYYYGSGRYNVSPYEDVHAARRAKVLPIPIFNNAAYLETFPHDRLSDLSAYGVDGATEIVFGSLKLSDLSELIELPVQGVRHNYEGVALMDGSAVFRLPIHRLPEGLAFLTLQIGRTKTGMSRSTIATIKVNNVLVSTLVWRKGDPDDQSVQLRLPEALNGRYLELGVNEGGRTKASLVLRRLEIVTSSAPDIYSLNEVRERGNSLQAEQERLWMTFQESGGDWLVDIDKLNPTSALRKESSGRNIRLLDRAALMVPRALLEQTRLLFLTGPSASSARAVHAMRIAINGQLAPTETSVDPSTGAWRLKCDTVGLRRSLSQASRIEFRFDTTPELAGLAGAPPSLLVRKIAFAKRL